MEAEQLAPADSADLETNAFAPLAPARTRWIHWLLLAVLLSAGGVLRYHQIVKESLWLDEYWSLYLSTGRGQIGTSIFDAPLGVILNPPVMGNAGAPHWWHIWTGLSSCVHPPVYYIALRWWIDLMGDSDISVRGFSAVLGLAGAVVLFDILRRRQGPWQGLAAAGMMTFAVSQIDYSQESRNYTILVFLGLLAVHALVVIEQKGVKARRLIWLGFLAAAMALTHYFAAGALLGLAVYVLIRFKGRDRRAILASLVIAGLVVAISWGPWFWWSRPLLANEDGSFLHDSRRSVMRPILLLISAPSRLLLAAFEANASTNYPIAVMVLLLPIFYLKRHPDVLLWWLWLVGSLAFIGFFDLQRGTLMLAFLRYDFIASPAVYALLATSWPVLRKWGWLTPSLFLLATVIYGAGRYVEGPQPKPHQWRSLTARLDRVIGPDDVIVFTTCSEYRPANPYIASAHYLPDSKRRIVLVDNAPPTAETLKQLAAVPNVWIIGSKPPQDMAVSLPGWRGTGPSFFEAFQLFCWKAVPPGTPL